MPSRPTRAAAFLSAALLFAPPAARFASAADDPAKPAPADAADKEAPKDAPPAEGRGRVQPGTMIERIESALKDLSLSDEQKTKVKSLVGKAKEAAGNAGQSGRERLQSAARALVDLREGLGNVLSDEQKKALVEKLPFLGRGAAAGSALRPAAVQRAIQTALEKVHVSDEQKAKLKVVTEETQKAIRELVDASKGERDALAEKVRPILEAQRQKISQILSAEQLPKFRDAVREQMEKLRGEAGGDRPDARPGDKKADEAKPQEQ